MRPDVLKEAKRLYDLGFAIHWLHPKSKRPVETGWTTGPRKSWAVLKKTYHPGYNVGVRLGRASPIRGGFLAVIDLDIKSKDPKHQKEALAAVALVQRDSIYPTVHSGRGNGSRHYYAITSSPFKTFNPAQSSDYVRVHQPSKAPSKGDRANLSEKDIAGGYRWSRAWEVSLYSEGRQVVLPPSLHPDSGELYRWSRKLESADDLPILDFMTIQLERSEGSGEWALSGSALGAPGDATTANAGAAGGSGGSVREAHETLKGFKVEPIDLGWLNISDEIREGIISGKGVTDRSAYLLRAASALISAELTQNQVLSVLTDPNTFLGECGYEHAQTKNRARAAAWVYRYTFKKVASERDASSVFAGATNLPPPRKLSPEEIEKQNAELADEWNWRQDLDKSQHGKTKVTLKNLDLIFSNAIDGTVFTEDLFASRIEYGIDTPWGGKAKEYIQDIDLIRVKRWLADTEFGIEPNKDAVLEATLCVADRSKFHPVRDWLESLKWDGKNRISTWIKDYCQGVAEEPYFSEVSRKFILAMVKRIFEPGCQWDYVLVLEGKQGKYKSSIARALATDKWFMDNLPDLKDKDSMLNLQGKWLIELGELADVKRADYNLVKAYLVRRTDTVRPHYGRLKADVPRQSVFIGTINEGQYLKDPTGNRRYWPVKVGLCDVRGLTAVRDQLFAEAMHIYRTKNEILMLSEEADAQATEAQEDRRVDDDESEMRASLIDFIHSEKSDDFDFNRFRARDLMIGPNAPWASWAGKGYFMNTAAQLLANLCFVRHKIRGQRYWSIGPETKVKKEQKIESKNGPENSTKNGVRKTPKSCVKNGGTTQNSRCPTAAPAAPLFRPDDADFL